MMGNPHPKNQFKKGHVAWSKLHPELCKPNSGSFKKGDNRGEKAYNWKGGTTKEKMGYILKKIYNHPYSRKSNYICEHRLVMEKKIGRYIKLREIVHHINGIKDDNRIENLLLLPGQKEHLKLHKVGRPRKIILKSNLITKQ